MVLAFVVLVLSGCSESSTPSYESYHATKCHAYKHVIVTSDTFDELKAGMAKRYNATSLQVRVTDRGTSLIARRNGGTAKALYVDRSRRTGGWRAFEWEVCG